MFAPHNSESVIKACGEILHVCVSGSPEILLESKPHKISKIDSPIGTRIHHKPVDQIANRFERLQVFSRANVLESKQPIWLINQALLI